MKGIDTLNGRGRWLLMMITLIHVSACCANIFPSVQTVCDSNNICNKQLLMLGIIADDNPTFELSLSLGKGNLVASSENSQVLWDLKEPVDVRFARSSAFVELPLRYVGTAQNAYPEFTPLRPLESCPTDTQLCCRGETSTTRVAYNLRNNATILELYEIQASRFAYAVDITMQQGNVSRTVTATDSQSVVANPPLTADVSLGGFNSGPFDGVRGSRFCRAQGSNPFDPGFTVRRSAFGTTQNFIGFTKESFISSAMCDRTLAASLFPVDGSQNPYDQFVTFRGNTIGRLFPQCVLLGTKTLITSGELGARLGFNCAGQTTTFIFARVPVEDFFIRILSGEPKYLTNGEISVGGRRSFFVDVANLGKTTGQFEIVCVSCCLRLRGETDCTIKLFQSRLVSVEAATTRRTILTPVIELLQEHSGDCNMIIAMQGQTKASFAISFAAVVTTAPSAPPSGPLICPSPGRIEIGISGVPYCSSPCTVDQVLVPGLCDPVNCVTKYQGRRSFYNNQTGLCEPAAVCQGTEVRDPRTNLCVNLGSGGGQPPSTSGGSGAPSSMPPPPPSTFNTVCGPNGQLGTDGGCICDPGWQTRVITGVEFEWCSVRAEPVAPPILFQFGPASAAPENSIVPNSASACGLYCTVGLIVGGIILSVIGILILRCYIRRRCRAQKVIVSHKSRKSSMGKKNRKSSGKKGHDDDDSTNTVSSEDVEFGLLDGKAATPVSTPMKPKKDESSSEYAESEFPADESGSKGSSGSNHSEETDKSPIRQPSFIDDEDNVAEFVAELQREENEESTQEASAEESEKAKT